MKYILTENQKKIIDYNKGCVVVKACPGSGKTFSVAARIARLLKEEKFGNTGIGAMSFTNVATDEIKEKLNLDFGISRSLQYPHYLGTIDKFINTFIFLPHAHLITGAIKRPQLVGLPHRSWTKGKGDRQYLTIPGGRKICKSANPHGYFDSVSFNLNDELYRIVPAQEIHFSLAKDKYYKTDGTPKKLISELITAKWENFQLGFANQSDANYIACKVLENFPLVTKSIARKFKYFIIDEAQDTDEVQMRIIELLQAAGANNIMLIGDRDQSIFEWNNANPALFDAKYNAWEKIELDENWRSSQKICDFTQPLSSFGRSFAKTPLVAKFDYEPTIKGYTKNNVGSMQPILAEFFASCEQNSIVTTPNNVAVLFRGKSMAQYLGEPVSVYDFQSLPWVSQNYHVKDIIHGKLLLELGNFKEGYHYLEKGYFEAVNKPQNPNYYCSGDLISTYVEQVGFTTHRESVFKFIRQLPATTNQTITNWINLANQNLANAGLAFSLSIIPNKGNMPIAEYFAKDVSSQNKHPFYLGTIHSVKGRTFDATLILLDKKAGTHSNYSTMLKNRPKPEEEEELRTVYVGLTRPRKILMMAVPDEDVAIWVKKLSSNK